VLKVLPVTHAEIIRREAEYQKTRPGLHGQKRGRKGSLAAVLNNVLPDLFHCFLARWSQDG
jgi:hypothetical protein